jgi:hypothetical protein
VAAGPDVALRGARLVVLELPEPAAVRAHLHPGQRVLDLTRAPAGEVDALLVALGLPPSAANWSAAVAAGTVANSATLNSAAASVRRGELP